MTISDDNKERNSAITGYLQQTAKNGQLSISQSCTVSTPHRFWITYNTDTQTHSSSREGFKVPSNTHQRQRSSDCTVLTATSLVNGEWQILTPYRIETLNRSTKNCTHDYVGEMTCGAKFGANASTGGFWANRWNITLLTLPYLQPFWRYSASKNGLTLKSGFGVLQGHWKWRGSIDHVWLSISPSL